jgi:hypothetical protein
MRRTSSAEFPEALASILG